MTQHTPGPWTVREDKDEWAIIGSEPSWVTAVNKRNHNAEANSHLIAAAPNLLAALEWMVDNASSVPDGADATEWHAGKRLARAAIAKARGQ